MSTIADRLRNLYDSMVIANSVTNEFVEALPDCYDAVEAKGGTLPAQQTAANLPDAIESIPSGGGDDVEILYKTTDSSTISLTGLPMYSVVENSTDGDWKKITIRNFDRQLPANCFAGLSKLTHIKLNAPIYSIGNQCFNGCHSLVSVELNDGLFMIGTSNAGRAFRECVSLQEIHIPQSVIYIGYYSFTATTGVNIYMPDTPPQYDGPLTYDNNEHLIVSSQAVYDAYMATGWSAQQSKFMIA